MFSPFGKPEHLTKRIDLGVSGRFRKFSREWIANGDDSLDISWLQDNSDDQAENLLEPKILLEDAKNELEEALNALNIIMGELESGENIIDGS